LPEGGGGGVESNNGTGLKLEETMPAITKDDVKNYLKEAPMLEIAQLVKEIETEFGVSAAAAMPMMAMPAGGGAAAAPAEEKDSFTVVLTDVGDKKINVIKAVREVTSLGLKEAKDLVDGAPKTVKEGVSKAEAEEIKKKFAEAGAKIELK
jgi:large subunit ribosomal protein L7/L12